MSSDVLGGRILVVSPLQVYPTLSGGNLRTFSLASALAARGAEVFVYSFVGRKRDYAARARSVLQSWPSGVHEYVNRSLPGFLAGYGSYALGLPPLWLAAYLRAGTACPADGLLPKMLRERLSWCDAVIADFPFAHPVFAARSARGKVRVLNTHNVEHHLYQENGGVRSKALRQAVRRVELAAVRKAEVVISCSADDQACFKDCVGPRDSVVVPNGVDVRRFEPSPAVRRDVRTALGIGDSDLLVLFTASKWGPNQEAFDFLRAFVRAHAQTLMEQGIHFLVVGSVADSPFCLPGLTATGRVEAVEPFFAAADVAINPLVAGAGTNVKMCEFIAAHLPVLVTPFGARGYRIEDRRTGFLFDRANLMGTLLEVRSRFDADRRELRAMADRAFRANSSVVSMDECVLPLVRLLTKRSAGWYGAQGQVSDTRGFGR